MSTRARQPYDPWRDVNGVPIEDGDRVERVGGIVVSRSYTGRGYNRLLVRFGDEEFAIHPHMLRVVSSAPERIIGDLQSLLHGLLPHDLVRRPGDARR